MTRRNRSSTQKLAALATVGVVLTGGAVAAVTAVGQGESKGAAAHVRAVRVRAADLAAAATYLGLPAAQLVHELETGQSLAQIAQTTPGKSQAGLIEALTAQRRKRLAALSTTLTKRVTAEVDRKGTGHVRLASPKSRRRGMFAGPHHVGALAAAYLGLTPTQLRAALTPGKSLAQVADATSGKSAAGLIETLVAARRARLARALASGRVTKAKADAIGAKLTRRVTVAVNRRWHGD